MLATAVLMVVWLLVEATVVTMMMMVVTMMVMMMVVMAMAMAMAVIVAASTVAAAWIDVESLTFTSLRAGSLIAGDCRRGTITTRTLQ